MNSLTIELHISTVPSVKVAFELSAVDWLIVFGFLIGFILGIVAIALGNASTPAVVITGSAAVFVIAKLCGAYRRTPRPPNMPTKT